MMSTSRLSSTYLLGTKKVWVQLALGAITLQAAYALTGNVVLYYIAVGLTLLAGFLPWTFNFNDNSRLSRIYGHEWFRPVFCIGGIAALCAAFFFAEHLWGRALPIVFFIFLMTPARAAASPKS